MAFGRGDCGLKRVADFPGGDGRLVLRDSPRSLLARGSGIVPSAVLVWSASQPIHSTMFGAIELACSDIRRLLGSFSMLGRYLLTFGLLFSWMLTFPMNAAAAGADPQV